MELEARGAIGAEELLSQTDRYMNVVNAYHRYGIFTVSTKIYDFPCRRLQAAIDIGSNLDGFRYKKLQKPSEGLVVSDYSFNQDEIHLLDIDGMDTLGIKAFMAQISYQILFSNTGGKNTTGFFLLKLKECDTKIPIRLSFPTTEEGISVSLYKEDITDKRFLMINAEDIERIEVVTMVTLRGLRRSRKYKERAQQNLTEDATSFKPDLI